MMRPCIYSVLISPLKTKASGSFQSLIQDVGAGNNLKVLRIGTAVSRTHEAKDIPSATRSAHGPTHVRATEGVVLVLQVPPLASDGQPSGQYVKLLALQLVSLNNFPEPHCVTFEAASFCVSIRTVANTRTNCRWRLARGILHTSPACPHPRFCPLTTPLEQHNVWRSGFS